MFPFANAVGAKRRPAVVVQNDAHNRRLGNTVLAAITTTTRNSGEDTQVLVDPAQVAGTGLLMTSVVSCTNLTTLERRLISRVVGRLPDSAMELVDAGLKAALGIA